MALWRETLLAQKVLRGETKGYRNHPQLIRFRASNDPISAVGCYLKEVAKNAKERGYAFDESKIVACKECAQIEETEGQLMYEWRHLKRKLTVRNQGCYEKVEKIATPDPHPLFTIIPGDVRDWEKR